mgnify:CR=1 FL=1
MPVRAFFFSRRRTPVGEAYESASAHVAVLRPGDMLIFVAGQPPIKGQQALYFQDKELLARARMPAPVTARPETGSAVGPGPATEPSSAVSDHDTPKDAQATEVAPAAASARPSYRAALAAQDSE